MTEENRFWRETDQIVVREKEVALPSDILIIILLW